MHRHFTSVCLAVLAAGLVLAGSAFAGDEAALRDEVAKLRTQVEALSAQQATMLEDEIDSYLGDQSAWQAAQGGEGGLKGVSLSARFTAVNQSTLGYDPVNRSLVNGDVDLDFDMQVTDRLDLFVHLTANATDYFGNEDIPSLDAFPAGGFDIGAFSASGATDGIGINGTVPTAPGSITVYEAGIRYAMPVGEMTLNWEMGSLDPRTRFLQTAYADDENTQFINNLFDDSPSIWWLTDATGVDALGWYMWLNFGDQDQFELSWGWWNTAGQWWNNGQFYAQFAWEGEVDGRALNLRAMVLIDEVHEDGNGDGDLAFGFSGDYLVTEKIGLFFRFAMNNEDINPVEMDFEIGAAFFGLIESRPDDVIGVAFGYIAINDTVTGPLPEDTEMTIEVYYNFALEDGKLQVTPHFMWIMDPNGNAFSGDDSLMILGVRVFVPF